jgi:hypothetical protein
MLHLIKKILLSFSFNRKKSHNLKPVNKGSQGNVLVNTGDHCSPLMANGDINIYSPLENRNLIEESEMWKTFLFFISRASSILIDLIKDPRKRTHFDRHIKSWKNDLVRNFKKIHFHPNSPNANRFLEIHNEVMSATDNFIKIGDEATFINVWTSCQKALASIKDSELGHTEDNKASKK